MYIVSKSVSTDFIHGYDTTLFTTAVKTAAIITSTYFDGCSNGGDEVLIYFGAQPTNAELTALNNLIANFTPTYQPNYTDSRAIPTGPLTITNPNYKLIYKLVATSPGMTATKWYATSFMDTGATSYSIRLFNATSKTVIVENTFTNTTEAVEVLGVGTAIPAGIIVLEVHGKINGTGSPKAYLNGIVVQFA